MTDQEPASPPLPKECTCGIHERELLPCPFCGGEPIMLKDHKQLGIYIACQECSVCTVTSDRAAAVAAWNRRPTSTHRTAGETIGGGELRLGLKAAIRAAKLALFVINKAGVMPNSSWEGGFNRDLAIAEAALAPPPVEPAQGVTEAGEGWVLVPKAALDWLNGEGPDDDGFWFGDSSDVIKGGFWWRSVFNRMRAVAGSGGGE